MSFYTEKQEMTGILWNLVSRWLTMVPIFVSKMQFWNMPMNKLCGGLFICKKLMKVLKMSSRNIFQFHDGQFCIMGSIADPKPPQWLWKFFQKMIFFEMRCIFCNHNFLFSGALACGYWLFRSWNRNSDYHLILLELIAVCKYSEILMISVCFSLVAGFF